MQFGTARSVAADNVQKRTRKNVLEPAATFDETRSLSVSQTPCRRDLTLSHARAFIIQSAARAFDSAVRWSNACLSVSASALASQNAASTRPSIRKSPYAISWLFASMRFGWPASFGLPGKRQYRLKCLHPFYTEDCLANVRTRTSRCPWRCLSSSWIALTSCLT